MSSDIKTRERVFTPADAVQTLEENFSLEKGSIKRTILERVYHEATGHHPNPNTPESEFFARAVYEFTQRLREMPPDPYRAFKLFLQDSRNIPQITARHFRIKVMRGYEVLHSALDVRLRVLFIFSWSKEKNKDEKEAIRERMTVIEKVLNALKKGCFEDNEVGILENIRILLTGDKEKAGEGYRMLDLVHFDEWGRPTVPSYLEALFSARKTGSKKKGNKGSGGSPSNPPAVSGPSGTPAPVPPNGSSTASHPVSSLTYVGQPPSCILNCTVMQAGFVPLAANTMFASAVL